MTTPSKISNRNNCKMSISEGVLTIRIVVDETKVDAQPSASGKMLMVASTGGYTSVPDSPLRLSLNLGRKP